jgi:hypothetical protein
MRKSRGFLQADESTCTPLQAGPEVDKLQKSLGYLGFLAEETGRLWI